MKTQKINDNILEFKAKELTDKKLITFILQRIVEIQEEQSNHFMITVHKNKKLFDINGYVTIKM